ncbi:ABC transporter ATP-binding protein [Candidatus Cloacimonadota bacterium]
MLQISDLSFRYESAKKWLFRKFSFSADAGSIIAIHGPSGSGKTTLFNIICGVIPKMIKGEFSGEVKYNNQLISELTLPQTAPHISLLMQEPDNQLFFPTVEQELAFGPENLNVQPDEIQTRIDNVLNDLGIEKLRFEETNTLSYGQKKLVTFASLLTLSPQVFLLDELSAGLSEMHLAKVHQVLKSLKEDGKIIFIADHNPAILQLAEKQIILSD